MPSDEDPEETPAPSRVDPTAQRLLNLLFILNAARGPVPTSRIVSDSDLGYGSSNPASDLRKFRRDRTKLAQRGIIIEEIHPVGTSETEESSWAIDRERTFAAGGIVEEADARVLIRAIDDYLRDHATPLAKPLRAVRAKAVEALAALKGELPERAGREDAAADPVADAVWTALSQRRRLVFSYTNARGEASERSVAVYGVFTEQGQPYLTGLDDKTSTVRTFRLERIERIRALGEPYRIPSDFALADQLFLPFDLADEEAVEVSFAFPSARTEQEILSITMGRGRIDRTEDGAWTWTTTARNLDKASAFALQHARDGMRPRTPKPLVQAWGNRIRKAVDAHER